MGHVLQMLSEGEKIYGVTSLDNLLYVLRNKLSEEIEVFDTDTYSLQHCLTVPKLGNKSDIVACPHNRCAYISDSSHNSIHRLALPYGTSVTNWPVSNEPTRLSVTGSHNILVTCRDVKKIKEFNTNGKLLRQLQLPLDIASPSHTIQLSSGQFVLCHGGPANPVHRVCLVDSEGRVVQSYGGARGSGSRQLHFPCHLAVDRNDFAFVADMHNHRVLLLSPSLSHVHDVVRRRQFDGGLVRLCFDANKRLLCVAFNENRRGRVAVVAV